MPSGLRRLKAAKRRPKADFARSEAERIGCKPDNCNLGADRAIVMMADGPAFIATASEAASVCPIERCWSVVPALQPHV